MTMANPRTRFTLTSTLAINPTLRVDCSHLLLRHYPATHAVGEGGSAVDLGQSKQTPRNDMNRAKNKRVQAATRKALGQVT